MLDTINRPYIRDGLAALFFLILTIIVSWPVLTNLDSVLIGYDNDVYINPWADWWTLKAWQDPSLSLWETAYLFYPQGTNLSYHSFSHLNTLLSLALRPLVGTIPAYNLSILVNYVLIGLAMFQFARYMTGSSTAGLLAGIIFAFNSHSLYQSCHPVLLSIWCFPWVTLYFMRAIEEDNLKLAAIAAIFVFLGSATSTILLIMLALWLLFLLLTMRVAGRWKRPSQPVLLGFCLFSVLLVLPLLFPLLSDALINRNTNFIVDPQASIVADIMSPFIPHWLVWYQRGIYFGYIPFYFLLSSLRYGPATRLWSLLLIGAYLLSIGPRPELLGRTLDITLPWSYTLTPILRNMYRMNILVSFALAMLVAYGWLVIVRELKTPRKRYLVAAAATLLIFADYAAPGMPHLAAPSSRFFTEYLADVPDDVVLAIIPSGRQEDKLHMYFQTLHGHKMTGGTVSRPTEEVFDFIYNNAILRAGVADRPPVPLPEDLTPALQELAAANIGYLLLNKAWMSDDELSTWQAKLPFSPIFEDHLLVVYPTGINYSDDASS